MWWVIHILGVLISWHYTDLESESVLQSAFFPLLIGLFLTGLLLKAVVALGHDGRGGGGGDGGGGSFFGGGGDGGGGDGGGC